MVVNWTRRSWLAIAGAFAGGATGFFARPSTQRARENAWLRPPGARDEEDFLAACIRCGQCVQACPFDTLHFAGVDAGRAVATPTLTPRDVPCRLCAGHDGLLCIEACPSGALEPVADERAIRMGTAVVDTSRCLAYNQVICRACFNSCPYPFEAIRLGPRMEPIIDAAACIGCGLCDEACLTEPSSITIRPAAALANDDVEDDA